MRISALSIEFGKELLYYSSIMIDWCFGSINYAKSHGVPSEKEGRSDQSVSEITREPDNTGSSQR